jgi:predicted Zn-dependent protease
VSEGGALSPEAVAEAFDGARGLLVAATPKALEEAAVRMSQAGLPQPEAEQLAALAGSVYRLLYAERGVPPEFPPPGVYSGPYQPALADAALGRPPRAGWSPPAGAAAEGVGEAGAAKDQAARQGPAGGRSARAAARRAARKGAESAERQPETTGAEGRLTELLNRVIPALYLARVDSPDSVPGSGLEGGLEEGLELAREANPGSVVPPYLLGRAAELAGRREQAEELFRGCLALSDSFYPARRRLAALYLAEGRGAQAAQQLEELHAEFPRDGVLRDSLIQARLLAGEPEQVSALVAEALVDNPDSPAYLLLRVRILLDRGDWPQALKPLGLLLRRHPEEREAHLLAARIYFEQAGDLDRALELIREAERRFPNDPTFPELAGSMLLAENRSDEGLEQVRRALELEPGRVSSLRLVVAEAMRRHQWVLAGRTLQQVLAREQTDQDLRDAYAVATHVGDRERALGYADTLYRREASGEARLRYAEALLEAGKAEEARGLLAGADAGQFATPEAVSSL